MAIEKKTSRKDGGILKALAVVVVLALVAGTGFLGYKFVELRKDNKELKSQLEGANQQLSDFRTNPERAAEAEVQRYVEEVGKLYTLPTDEQPAVATVSDKSKLEDQAFFANAENGDVTLIYSEAKLAILYRPSTNKIINVNTVTIEQKEE